MLVFYRYIPLSRINVPLSTQSTPVTGGSFPSLSACDEIANAPSSSLIQCKFGSVEAVAKVCSCFLKTFQVYILTK